MSEKYIFLQNILHDRSGNFGLMTAILLPVLIGVAGVAIDTARALQLRTAMQANADSALLAAATSLAKDHASVERAQLLASQHYASRMLHADFGCATAPTASDLEQTALTTVNQFAHGKNAKRFELSFQAGNAMCVNPLTAVIAGPVINIAVAANTESATESKNAFSMHLVLDQSVSMADKVCLKRNEKRQCDTRGNNRRIDALKDAVRDLFDIIETADPDGEYARTAAVAFSGKMGKTTDFDWGVDHTREFVRALNPSGRTDASDAMRHAYQSLSVDNRSEATAHAKKQNVAPKKYIVYMTDGNNNDESIDNATLTSCQEAKNENVVVFTIAFDTSEARAERLLKACAHTIDHFYDARTSEELLEAFKEIGARANAADARLTS